MGDTDNDDIPDYLDWGETSPLDADSDDDRLPDGNVTVGQNYIGEDLNLDGVRNASSEPDPLNPDSDREGYDDKTDEYPLDSVSWEKEAGGKSENPYFVWILIVIIIVIIVIILIFSIMKR